MSEIARKVTIPAIQDLPDDLSPNLREVLEQIILSLDIREGRVAKGTNQRFVTIQDLIDAGLVADGVII